MSELTTVARPYAIAAFDSALENKKVAEWQSMLAFASQVAQDQTVKQLLTSSMSADGLANVFINLCGEQIDNHGQNFVRVLAENKRLQALPAILQMFEQLKADYDKEVDVDVTSATELSAEQQTEISKSLEQRLSRKVKLNCNVDSALIAGFVIKAGDTVIDGSIKSKLNRLADSLQA